MRNSAIRLIPALLLIVTNLVAIVGVLFWQWDSFQILIFYWLELTAIFMYILLKIVVVGIHVRAWWKMIITVVQVFFYGSVFLFNLGGIMMGLFVPEEAGFSTLPLFYMQVVFVVFLIIHGISFYIHFWSRKEYAKHTLVEAFSDDMFSSFAGRTLGMWVFLIFGAFLFGWLGEPKLVTIAWIVVFLFLNLRAHAKSHQFRFSIFRKVYKRGRFIFR